MAGVGLPNAPALPRDSWDEHLDAVFRHGLAGFLASSAVAQRIDLDGPLAERLRVRLKDEAIQAVRLEGELLRLSPLLDVFPVVVLKGAVLAHAAYPDPLLRPFTDLDLLVPGPRLEEFVVALAAYGYERSRPEPTPGYDALVGKALTLVHPGGVVIDLHRNLVAGNLGTSIDVDAIVAERIPVMLGSMALPAPSWEAHLIECALHAVVGDGLARALSLRDVAQVALHPHLDLDGAVALAERWNVSQVFADGLRASMDGLGLVPPEGLAVLADEPIDPSLGMPASVRSARSRLDELRRGDLRRRATVTRAMVVPSPEFLRWRYGDQSLPRLYALRWRSLHQRAAQSDPAATAPPAPAVEVALRSVTGPVALAERPILTTVDAGRKRVTGSQPDSRQARWSNARPPRPQPPPSSDPGTRPPPPDQPARFDAEAAAEPSGHVIRPPSGVPLALTGGGLLVVAAIGSQLGSTRFGVVLVPVAAVLLAIATSRRITRVHPDEAWVGRWLVMAVFVKLLASYFRYHTLVETYAGVGDATGYDRFGRELAAAWMGDGTAPVLPDLRRTNFIRWFTGVVYSVFGSNMVAGFFVFGLLALVGSYLWYRATVDAVPGVNRRLYLGLVLFAPSITFWPASIGKEALMQLGLGAMALGTAYLLRQRLLAAAAVGATGGWLVWVVRPHLLALVTVAAACAYFAGRVRLREQRAYAGLRRPVGLLLMALLVVFAVSQGAKFLGIEQLSLSSIEAELDEQTERSAQGGSQFDNGGNSLNPINLPRGAVTVLLRPFPWETDSNLQLLAALESVLLATLIIVRLPSLRAALLGARTTPFLLYCWVLTILYAATFSSFANFGLLVRQRSLVLPALVVLLAVEPVRHRNQLPEPSAILERGEPSGVR